MQTFDTHGTILGFTSDQGALYTVIDTSEGQCLLTLLLPTLEEVDRKYFNPPIYLNTNVSPFVDESYLYLPVQGGQILKLDKFSGMLARLIDVGAMEITAVVHQDEQYIYCLCGIPLRVGKNLSVNNFSICCLDTTTGKKIRQSSILQAPVVATWSDGFYVISGSTLIQMSPDFQVVVTQPLAMTGYLPPAVSKNHLICTSGLGTVEIFARENLKFIERQLLDKIVGQPVLSDEQAIFFAHSGIHTLNLNTRESVLKPYPVNAGPRCVKTENGYFAGIKNRILQYKNGIVLDKAISIDDLIPLIPSNNLILTHDGRTIYALETLDA